MHRGVPELLYEPPQHILTEAAGLERFAEQMRAGRAGTARRVLRLPDLEHGYWYVQARSIHQLLTTVPFLAGQSILDVGSNTCWAANHFAERGLRAIALDIATVELQGLYTADWFIDDGQRVLRAGARLDGRDPAGLEQRRLRLLLRRSCTTTTPPGCAGRSPRSSGCCGPGDGC